jgi:hypothetical protein
MEPILTDQPNGVEAFVGSKEELEDIYQELVGSEEMRANIFLCRIVRSVERTYVVQDFGDVDEQTT